MKRRWRIGNRTLPKALDHVVAAWRCGLPKVALERMVRTIERKFAVKLNMRIEEGTIR